MDLEATLAELEALGDEKRRAFNVKNGAGKAKQFGVAMGALRALAKKIKSDHALALELWKTGNIDAQLLAILLMKPKALSAAELDKMVRAARFAWVADWFNAYIVKERSPADQETLRVKWLEDEDGWAARAGWSLTAAKIGKGGDGLDVKALLDRIESEMAAAPPETQWTMNAALAAVGIHFAEQRKRAIAIGERLGIYRDYPCAKGCTSPFAPIWIDEMVRRSRA